jgi:hypothetical protein
VEVRLYGSKRTSLAFENYLAKVLVRSIPGIQRKDKGSASVPCHTKTFSASLISFMRTVLSLVANAEDGHQIKEPGTTLGRAGKPYLPASTTSSTSAFEDQVKRNSVNRLASAYQHVNRKQAALPYYFPRLRCIPSIRSEGPSARGIPPHDIIYR